MHPSDLKLLRQILEAIRGEIASVCEAIKQSAASIAHERIEQNHSNQEQWKQTQEVLASLRPEPHQQAAAEANQQRRHRQNLLVQRVLTLGTWLAFTAAAIYAWEAHRQIKTMDQTYGDFEKQTGLMQKQVEASAGAILFQQFRINWPEPNSAYLSVILDNRGHTAASSIHGEIAISEVSVLNDARTTKSTFPRWVFSIANINFSPAFPLEQGTYLRLSEDRLVMPNALKLTGKIDYFNGFSTRSDDLCYYVTGAMIFRNKSGAVQQSSGPSVLTCGALPPQIAYWRETQKQIGSQ